MHRMSVSRKRASRLIVFRWGSWQVMQVAPPSRKQRLCHKAAPSVAKRRIRPSGQIGGMLKERRPARDILMDLVNGAEETIEGLQGNLR